MIIDSIDNHDSILLYITIMIVYKINPDCNYKTIGSFYFFNNNNNNNNKEINKDNKVITYI